MNSEKLIVKCNGKQYSLYKYMYGVLSKNPNNPLCCVSESNNSFSIDYWKGCTYQCAYCHVQGICEDLDDGFKMIKYPVKRTKFKIEEIIDELIKHKFFYKNESLISIGTSSTEPFGNEIVSESTISIMEYFVKKKLKNPFWIVTKAGIPEKYIKRILDIAENGNKIMISICYANNPKKIEPVQNNRFRNIECLNHQNIVVSWYLRPLVKEWGANKKNLSNLFQKISSQYGQYIDMIVPGGLRWTEGIEFGMNIQKGLKMPRLSRNEDTKTLSTKLIRNIKELSLKYFPGKPVYFHSSCAISHMMNKNNIALMDILNKKICKASICKNPCSKCCMTIKKEDLMKINRQLKQEGINIKIRKINSREGIISEPDIDKFEYTYKQQIKKSIAYSISKI